MAHFSFNIKLCEAICYFSATELISTCCQEDTLKNYLSLEWENFFVSGKSYSVIKCFWKKTQLYDNTIKGNKSDIVLLESCLGKLPVGISKANRILRTTIERSKNQ